MAIFCVETTDEKLRFGRFFASFWTFFQSLSPTLLCYFLKRIASSSSFLSDVERLKLDLSLDLRL